LNRLTFESAGFVENLSFCSPYSSKRITTLSIVHTAIFSLLGDQVAATTLAAPSY